ncbi:hypothetical protein FA95DRAFT_1565278 [Auriscalpium vulgare]|uniref:Uncharacterized protein n=1 Tax=Auriscalpium vulgare TaxID=40419 RepID=A0ACB8RBJ3_9AGAM|nr:hypothetical protein FA95DRAFT_1565278 [Auriscalpium vulgare]
MAADAKVENASADPSASASTATLKKSMVEIKNGKVLFRQKPMSFSQMTETMQETVKLRELLERRIECQDPPLAAIPLEHKPLIAKFVQESDKTINALSKHIQQQLVPAEEDEEEDTPDHANRVLPLATVEEAILSLAQRVNYGIDVINSVKIPASLSVWRWEVKPEHYDWLPKASREKIETRLADRVQAKKELQILYEALPQSERDAMVGVKSTTKAKTQAPLRAASNDAAVVIDLSSPSPVKSKDSKVGVAESENDSLRKGPGRPKKELDPEQVAKEKERQEKKAAKAEKDKKEKEAQTKARSMMVNFFGKPKASSTSVSPAKNATASSSSKTLSDFDKVFKPFVVKKDVEIAPTNWFRTSRRRQKLQDSDVIDVDVDEDDHSAPSDVEMIGISPSPNLSPKSHLRALFAATPPSVKAASQRRRLPSSRSQPPASVRALMAQLGEAELTDDTAAVRSLLTQLRDRTLFPAKVLIFHEDERPGYFGTFTRQSRSIRPRRPFARDDVALDYAYDSGEEWEGEEEGGGDDVADVSDDDQDEEEDEDDLDGWLVDGDDEEAVTPIEEREGLDAFPFPPPPPPNKGKRKAETLPKEAEKKGDGAKAKKRKIVVPLVPFIKGPCWETVIGKCDYDPFKQYRIQLFNDTPYPLDPFTFVSTSPAEVPRVLPTPSATSLASSSKSTPQFAVPALPPHVLNATSTQPLVPKKPKQVPKHPFPDVHLPYLLKKVTQLAASSLPLLVEAIYQDLKTHHVKKNAVEAKIRETCVKDQNRWVVKDGATACAS